MGSRDLEQNYYEILEISTSAAHHEIVAAYHRAKEAYAADSPALYTMFTDDEARELRSLIEEAFLILGNQTKRKEYDQLLSGRNGAMTASDLPDFEPIPQVAPVAKKSERREPLSENTIPDGFAKSRLSVYEINHEVEDEIQKQHEYDGAFIRKIRLYKNINLEQLSKETELAVAISLRSRQKITGSARARLPARICHSVVRYLGLNER